MIHTARECRETFRMLEAYQREGRQRYITALHRLRQERRAGNITDQFSLRTMYEHLVPDGAARLRDMEHRRRYGSDVVMEAGGDAITTAHFSNIFGQVAFADVLENFAQPEFIGSRLLTPINATTQYREIIPGITLIGDKAEPVGENEEYPLVGVSEQFVTLPEIYKEGFMVAVTEEAIFEDKTGLLMRNLNRAAESMAITEEKERLAVVLGVTNTYSRNGGPIQNTYANTHTEGGGDNLFASNPMLDYLAFEASSLGYEDLLDPDTGEPIILGGPQQIVVPRALQVKTWRALNSSLIRTGDPLTGVQQESGNPVQQIGQYEVLSNQYVKSVSGSATSWYTGNFKKAFIERVIYNTQVQVEDRNSGAGWSRDIAVRIKVRKKTRPAVWDWRYVQKHTT